jgi:hypothetical protein
MSGRWEAYLRYSMSKDGITLFNGIFSFFTGFYVNHINIILCHDKHYLSDELLNRMLQEIGFLCWKSGPCLSNAFGSNGKYHPQFTYE